MAETKLPKEIFSCEVENHELLKLAYDAYLSNSRSAHAKTLKRGEVRGGGKKPWKQKGTGRARFGSSRNPIWRHGGIAFGPDGKANFVKKISTHAKKVAVVQALSLANKDKLIKLTPDFTPKNGKVKDTLDYYKSNNLKTEVATLLICTKKTPLALRATNNIPYIRLVRPTYLNVYDILNADQVVITESALPEIVKWLKGEA
ncbi:50S ribosomal protein L4 [Clostridia bacterium]|nr:50S ribosomal protein L4 [Clostridia bacterium]